MTNESMSESFLTADHESVMLKALHSGALALSKQRRALLRNQQAVKNTVSSVAKQRAFNAHSLFQADTASDVTDSLYDVASNESVYTKLLPQGQSSTPELEYAEPRDAREKHFDDFIGDDQKSWLKPRASLESEVAALSLKHRSYIKRKPGSRRSLDVDESSGRQQSLRSSLAFDTVPVADSIEGLPSCRVCGDTLSPTQAGRLEQRVAEYREEAQSLSARLEVAEELLHRIKPEAARAKSLQLERDAERARAEDLASCLRATHALSAELKRGFEQQSLDFKKFIAHTKLHSDAIEGSLESLHFANQNQESPPRRKHQQRGVDMHEAKRLDELHHELNQERAECRRSTVRLSEWSMEKLENERLTQELRDRSRSYQEELHQEQSHASTIRRQSTLLGVSVRQREEQADELRAHLAERDSDFRKSQDEARELKKLSRTETEQFRQELASHDERHAELTAARKIIDDRTRMKQLKVEERRKHRDEHWVEVFSAVAMAQKGSRMRLACQRGANDTRWKPWKDKDVSISKDKKGSQYLQWKSIKNQSKVKKWSLDQVTDIQIAKDIPFELQPLPQPWNCFILWILNAPFVFWTHLDDIAKSFIIALTHLCVHLKPIRNRELVALRALYKMGVDKGSRAQRLLVAIQRTKRLMPEPRREEEEDNPDCSFVPEREPRSRHEDAPHPEASSSGAHRVLEHSGTLAAIAQRQADEQRVPSSSHAPEGQPHREVAFDAEDVAVDMVERADEDDEGEEWYEESQSSTRDPGTTRSASSQDRGHATSATE